MISTECHHKILQYIFLFEMTMIDRKIMHISCLQRVKYRVLDVADLLFQPNGLRQMIFNHEECNNMKSCI